MGILGNGAEHLIHHPAYDKGGTGKRLMRDRLTRKEPMKRMGTSVNLKAGMKSEILFVFRRI